MVFYTDNLNNYFMGDLTLDNSTNYLESNVTLGNVYNPLLNLLIRSGLCLDYIPFEVDFKSQFTSNLNAFRNSLSLIISAGSSFPVGVQRRTVGLSIMGQLAVYNPPGYPIIGRMDESISTTNRASIIGNVSTATNLNTNFYPYSTTTDESAVRFFGVADSNTLGLLITQPTTNVNAHPLFSNRFGFYYVTYLPASNFSVQNATRYIRFASSFFGGNPTSTGLYRNPRETGTITNIVCGKHFEDFEVSTNIASSSTEELQYATDYMFTPTNSETSIALPHLKLGTGYYEPLKPIKLLNFTEPGNNTWIPVGLIGGKTLLLRCYSSSLDNTIVTSVPLLNNKEVTYPHYRPSNP